MPDILHSDAPFDNQPLCLRRNLATVRLSLRWAIVGILLLNAIPLLSPVINEGDSVVYAALAQHMVWSGDWWNLVLSQQDWLDKPHFPFWVTAAFFKWGGVSALTYALPGYLFHLLGAYFTYRLARLLYDADTALLALLVYVSTLNLMYTATNVRAEAYLCASITAASYYCLRLEQEFRWKYLLLAALAAAIALMTKGIFTLVPIGSGVLGMWLVRGRWRQIAWGRWLLLGAATALFTAPELWALYVQFDAHPEKLVFGHTGVSGIRFFLWESQFGRFFNTGPITGSDADPLYYVHVFLWTFMPWIGVFFLALYTSLRSLANQSPSQRAAWAYLASSFAITFLLFSASEFQGDYYLCILFPFAAISCAHYLVVWLQQRPRARWLDRIQFGIAAFLSVLALGFSLYLDIAWITALTLTAVAGFALWQWRMRPRSRVDTVLLYPMFGMGLLYGVVSLMTWVAMTRYSVAYNVSQALRGLPDVPVYVYKMDTMIPLELQLYSQRVCVGVEQPSSLPAHGDYLLLSRDPYLPELQTQTAHADAVLQGHWINHKTGNLPRTLRLAKGQGPLEPVRMLLVHQP